MLNNTKRKAKEANEPPPTLVPQQANNDFSSVVSYPRRNNRWGDPRFRGNCDGTLFRDLVLHYGARRIADPMMGSGTTFDVVRELNEQTGRELGFFGRDLSLDYDLSEQALPQEFDFVWVHPPYWNIIQYSQDPADLSTCATYDDFVVRLRRSLLNAYAGLVPGGRLAVLVGDVRRRGQYFPIGRDVQSFEGALGTLRSVIIKVQHNCTSDRRKYGNLEDARIKHEYCIVFKKPVCR